MNLNEYKHAQIYIYYKEHKICTYCQIQYFYWYSL